MPEKFSKQKRSWIMRQVKSKQNASTELKLIRYFKENNIRGWRRNHNLYGKPDFVFPLLKLIIFVDGCFWHGHKCKTLKPINNKDYWAEKIIKNKKRDRNVTSHLRAKKWKVIRVWECELKKERTLKTKIKFSFFDEVN